MSTVRVTVDPELCMGSGTCMAIAPEVFDMDEGAAYPRQDRVEPSSTLKAAISRCPAAAISAL